MSILALKSDQSPSTRINMLATSITTGRGSLLLPRIGLMLLLCAAIVVAGAAGNSMLRYSLTIGVISAVAVLGNNAVTGTLGEINLASGAYMAFGAYAMTWALGHGWSFLPSLGFALVVGVAVGALIAIPTVRLQGIFTALGTFALAFAIPDLIIALSSVTGGELGLAVPAAAIGGITLGGSTVPMLVLVCVVFAIVAIASLVVFSGSAGRVVLMVGEAAPAAHVFGIRATLTKVLVWTWASALGAIAGAMYALAVGFLNSSIFVSFLSITLLIGGLIGGTRNISGALIGGLVVGTLPLHMQSVIPAPATGLVFGAILLLALMTGRGGVGSALEKIGVKLFRRRSA